MKIQIIIIATITLFSLPAFAGNEPPLDMQIIGNFSLKVTQQRKPDIPKPSVPEKDDKLTSAMSPYGLISIVGYEDKSGSGLTVFDSFGHKLNSFKLDDGHDHHRYEPKFINSATQILVAHDLFEGDASHRIVYDVRDVRTGKLIKKFEGTDRLEYYAASSQKYIAFMDDKHIDMYDFVHWHLLWSAPIPNDDMYVLPSAEFVNDAKQILIYYSKGGQIYDVRDVKTGKLIKKFESTSHYIFEHHISPSQKLIVFHSSTHIDMYSMVDWRLLWSVPGKMWVNSNRKEQIKLERFFPSGNYYVIGSSLGKVVVFNATTGQIIRTIQAYKVIPCCSTGIGDITLDQKGEFLLIGSESPSIHQEEAAVLWKKSFAPVQIWRVSDGKLVASFTQSASEINALVWDPKGRYVAFLDTEFTVQQTYGSDKGLPPIPNIHLCIWQPETGGFTRIQSPSSGPLTISSDGNSIILGDADSKDNNVIFNIQ